MTKAIKWLCAQWRLRSACPTICPVWSESIPCTRTQTFFTRIANSQNCNQPGQTTGLICVFAWCTCHLGAHVILVHTASYRFHCAPAQMSRHMTKPTKWSVRPTKTQISLGIRPVWSESLQCAQWVDQRTQCFFMQTANTLITLGGCPGWSESSLGKKVILFVLSWGGSNFIGGGGWNWILRPFNNFSIISQQGLIVAEGSMLILLWCLTQWSPRQPTHYSIKS